MKLRENKIKAKTIPLIDIKLMIEVKEIDGGLYNMWISCCACCVGWKLFPNPVNVSINDLDQNLMPLSLSL
ncbi:hypothetical protein DERF_014294 [Dermatophagoides farinae]|uniref:Uncharacterized protein n=1 Tax=Dermatophagoides farinae TaxID=6954 RepID=A0A922HMN1_DERFA|nr:hypothetical protein DERF_014294 [Dermatophagoides farinae]